MTERLLAEHVVFDLDGTLVDTRAAVFECYSRVFASVLGEAFPPPAIDPHVIFAMRPIEVFAVVAPDKVETCFAAYQASYPAASERVVTFPGARELIPAIRRAGRKASLVTNKGLARSRIDLERAGIAIADFSAVVTAEDTAERKPHPAPILLGLERLGAVADDALYVGDGPHDIVAAKAAGMKSVAITHGFYPRGDLEALGAEWVVDDIFELADALGLTLERAA